MSDIAYNIICSGLAGAIGFMGGALYGIRSGKRAGKLMGWITANQEILVRVNERKNSLVKPFINSNILMIEDNDDARQIMASVLKTYGYKVHEARTGNEGLRILELSRIDTAIIDLMLPDTSGYVIAKNISVVYPDIRLISLTGYELDEEIAKKSGFHFHLKKPYQINELITALTAEIK